MKSLIIRFEAMAYALRNMKGKDYDNARQWLDENEDEYLKLKYGSWIKRI